jgi:PAS domain S-box-containing protein
MEPKPSKGANEDQLIEGLRTVCNLADQLMDCPNLDALYRRAVELAREYLNVERCGLFLLEGNPPRLMGTYGTNFSRKTTNEHNLQLSIDYVPELLLKEDKPTRWMRWQKQLAEYDEDAKPKNQKTGWEVVTTVRSDEGLIGVFFNDTACTDAPMNPVQQELIAVYCYFVGNIISRKRSEQNLKESEEKYRLLFYNNPQPMFVYDLETLSILAVNDAAIHLYGYTREVFLGMKVSDFRIKEEVDAFIENIESFRSGANMTGEWRHICRDNRVIDVEVSSHAVTFEKRRARLVLVMDITERKRVQEEIERLAAFPRFNPNPIIEFESDGTMSYYNEAAEEMLASFKADMLEQILPPNYRQVVHRCLASDESHLRIETKIEDRTISWSFFPIISKLTKRWVVHCYGGEISERLRLEAQVRHAQKMESIGQLAGGVAHDFNNILTAIIGYSNLVKMRCEDKSELAQDAEQITMAANRAANLTKQLLAFSRRQFVSLRTLDFNKVIQNIQGMLITLTGEKIRLECAYASDLPMIRGDSNMLDQVILNLAVNARDAMPNGGVLSISTEAVEIKEKGEALSIGPYVRLRVSDTGVGMDEDTKSKIFEPFFTTKEMGHGTGLGLATVYGIVQQHEGYIEVKSKLDVGSTFDVFFPVALKTEEEIDDFYPETNEPSNKIEGDASAVILLVEDEEAVRSIAKTILEKQGYHVMEAESGLEAIKLWEKHSNEIDILFSDMVMPNNITGLDLANQFKQQKPQLRVILTSGYNIGLIEGKEKLPENILFVAKPYSSADLMNAITHSIGVN